MASLRGNRTLEDDKSTTEPELGPDGRRPRQPPKAESDDPQNPIHSAITTVFRNDQSVREAMSSNMREASTESFSVRDRAQEAFAGFSASQYSAAERARPNYLGSGDDLADSLETLVTRGAEALRTSAVPRSIRLRSTKGLHGLIKYKEGDDDSLVGTIDLASLVEYISPRAAVRPSQPPDPGLTTCMAEREAERRMEEIRGSGDGDTDNEGPGTTAPPGDIPAAANGEVDDTSAATDELVREGVDLLMESATSPESQVRYDVPKRSDGSTLQDDISTFELRAGPSDVTSYHDFSSLQIAFEHVWAEIFDGQLAALGQELYHEYVNLKVFAGVDDGTDGQVDTLDDLAQLMDEIRELGRISLDVTPDELRPDAGETGGALVAPVDVKEVAKTFLDPFSVISDNISDQTVRTLVNPVGAAIDAIGKLLAGKPQLTWDSFPGPLPVNGDIISATFEQDVVPAGTVEIVLRNSQQAWWWKGIEFREFDAAGTTISNFKISNDPRDSDVWDAQSYNVLPLYTGQVTNALLEFKKAAPGIGFGIHTGYYLLAGLDQRLKDRMRVTFTWEKDN